jgi:PIN domain nuclease of toxin-antitoxin system
VRPLPHTDPFDRSSIAHALEGDLGVLTRNQVFGAYGVWLAV